MQNILLTGGLGYIGSHIAVELLNSPFPYNVFIVDNLSNSNIEKLTAIKKNKTAQNDNRLYFYRLDLLDKKELDYVFSTYKIEIVIHLAGWKSVGESIQQPLTYYQNNLISTMNVLEIMESHGCKNLIFSSSATVYGNEEGKVPPYQEDMQTGINITNPYGKTKYIQEEMLRDLYDSDKTWNLILLRYFNPISQKNASLKENPNGIPNNLFPYIVKVYKGELKELQIFGNDYDTQYGTCIRDFIHVVDLARGHVKACEYIINASKKDITTGILKTYNVGTGKGISVKELIDAFEKENKIRLNYKYVERRPGDLAASYANVELAKKELGWTADYGLEDMVKL